MQNVKLKGVFSMIKEEIKLVCDKCGSPLKFEILNEKEIKKRLEKGTTLKKRKIDFLRLPIIIKAIKEGYSYFYCKKCDWGKFVKNENAFKMEKEGEKYLENKSKV